MHLIEPNSRIKTVERSKVACDVLYTDWLVCRQASHDIKVLGVNVTKRLKPYQMLIPFYQGGKAERPVWNAVFPAHGHMSNNPNSFASFFGLLELLLKPL